MNFSRNETNKKIRRLKTTSKRVSTKINVFLFRMVLVLVVAGGIILSIAGFGAIKGLIATSPELNPESIIPSGYTTYFYYSDGTISQTLIGSQANRIYVTIDKIPEYVSYSFVAIEDERFFEHYGIDVQSFFRAITEMVTTRSLDGSGGSTITMQLLKNQMFSGGNEENNIDKAIRKIRELYNAIQLENTLDKMTILEYYLNTINFGQGAYGIQTAAQTYFGKDVSELTLSEGAVLAAIAKSPTKQNPYRYPKRNALRREAVLDKMLEINACTQEEYDEAMADSEDVYARINEYVSNTSGSSYYSYFTDEVISQLIDELVSEKGYTTKEANDLIYSGGLKVFTTQDRDVQRIVDNVINNESLYPSLGNGSYYELTYRISVEDADGTVHHYQMADFLEFHNYFENESSVSVRIIGGLYNVIFYDLDFMSNAIAEYKAAVTPEGSTILGETKNMVLQPQISFTIMDHHTGAVVAISGGRGEKTGNRTLNRATESKRQVGSTFKVLASFLPALDYANMTLATVQDDIPYFYPDTTKEVRNWYTGYRGLSSLRRGISYSMNIVAVKTLAEVDPKIAYQYLLDLGFTTLVEAKQTGNGILTDINLSLALGGLTDGVYNIEMTAAYAAIANEGVYNKPYYYTQVLDHDGNVILSHTTESHSVMKASTAFLLTNAMQDTLVSGIGTASAAKFKKYSMPIAGKSGTTTDSIDLWFCGYTPYYTASIWTGFDNNYPVTSSIHLAIWRNIMEELHSYKQLEYKTFNQPDSIVTAQICKKSGKLAIEGLCDHAEGGSTVGTEYFAIGTAPTEYCDMHERVLICSETGELATSVCPHTVEKVLLNKVEPVIFIPTEEDPTTDPPSEENFALWESAHIAEQNSLVRAINERLFEIKTDTGIIIYPEGVYFDENGKLILPSGVRQDAAGNIICSSGDIIYYSDLNLDQILYVDGQILVIPAEPYVPAVSPDVEGENPEGTEPSDTTESTDATVPTDATEPTDTTDAAEPTEPTDSNVPAEGTEPADAANPDDTVPSFNDITAENREGADGEEEEEPHTVWDDLPEEKLRLNYTTSDTKYLVPESYCSLHFEPY